MLPIAVSLDDQSVTLFGPNNNLSVWNAILNTWSATDLLCPPIKGEAQILPALPSPKSSDFALVAPKSGFTYLPYSTVNGTQMIGYRSQPVRRCNIYSMPVDSRGMYYAGSVLMNSIYMVGTDQLNRSIMWQFRYDTESWGNLGSEYEVLPKAIPSGSCMVTGYTNGTEAIDMLFYKFRSDKWVGSHANNITGSPEANISVFDASRYAIIGGTLGAAVVVGSIIGFVFIRRRRQRSDSSHHSKYERKERRTANGILQHDTKLKSLSIQGKLNPTLASYTRLHSDAIDGFEKPSKTVVRVHDNNDNIKTRTSCSENKEDLESEYILPDPVYPPISEELPALTTPALPAPQYIDPNRRSFQKRPCNNPHYVAPVPKQTPSSTKLRYDLPRVDPPVHNPHGPRTSMPAAVDISAGLNKEAVQMQAWYEQALERMRKEHHKELAKHQVQMAKQKAKMAKIKKVLENHPPN
ncbi:hypothetical protein FBU30_000230 [Linnemannia zychae]|nr:hypothetical protein FBU30_000230 [Linnemannia zychae]